MKFVPRYSAICSQASSSWNSSRMRSNYECRGVQEYLFPFLEKNIYQISFWRKKIKSRILLAFFERFLFRFTLLQFLRCDHLKQTCILTSIDLCMSICYLLFMFVHDQNKDYLDIHISRLAGSPRFYQPKKNCIMDFLSF